MTRKIVSKMTYNVSSGTLNPTTPIQTHLYRLLMIVPDSPYCSSASWRIYSVIAASIVFAVRTARQADVMLSVVSVLLPLLVDVALKHSCLNC